MYSLWPLYALLFAVILIMLWLTDSRLKIAHGLFWLSSIPGIVSVFALDSFNLYISEQDRVSHFNYAGIILFLVLSLHFSGLWVSTLFFNKFLARNNRYIKAIRSMNNSKATSLGHIFLLFIVPIGSLALLYLNLLLSGKPPIFQEGYIDRFIYMQNTALWSLVRFFGVAALPVGILIGLGFYLLSKRYKLFLVLFFLLYITYLIVIGQKFGGVVLASFLFLLPILLTQVEVVGGMKIFKKYSSLIFILISASVFLVLYHYSRYSYSDNFGGPLGLFYHRIFVLQGHLFWGISNSLDFWSSTVYPDFSGLFHAMTTMMREVAPPAIAESAIGRGVNFTFGYFASYIYFIGIWGSIFYFFTAFFYGIIGYVVLSSILNRDVISYFFSVALLVWWTSYLGSGSVSDILSIQPLVFVFILIFWNIIRKVASKNVIDGSASALVENTQDNQKNGSAMV